MTAFFGLFLFYLFNFLLTSSYCHAILNYVCFAAWSKSSLKCKKNTEFLFQKSTKQQKHTDFLNFAVTAT